MPVRRVSSAVNPSKKTPPVSLPEGVGGREICAKTPLGRREYKRRVEQMWDRQGCRCALCGKYLRLDDATFDHERPRGMGSAFTDDRIEVNGIPQNAAVHGLCNSARGSRRTPYLIQPLADFDLPLEALLSEVGE